jgi:hypothetical protein
MISTGTSLFYNPYFCVYNYLVRNIVYIVCKTVITMEFHNAKYRRKQIKVHLNLPVEKMGHLYRVIKQHVYYVPQIY